MKKVITDHHLIPEKGPVSVDAFVNPQRDDCEYNKTISGCGVAYLTLSAVVDRFKESNREGLDLEYLEYLKSFVAISILGDSMDMSDINNRIIVSKGFHYINSRKDLFWDTVMKLARVEYVDEEFVGFVIGPMLNSASRMDVTEAAFNLMNSKTEDEVIKNYRYLNKINKERKAKQNKLLVEAENQLLIETEKTMSSITVLDNALGINGVLSSMIGRKTGKPTITFAGEEGKDTISGSGRATVNGFNIRQAYSNTKDKLGDSIVKFGGHKAAAGIEIKKSSLNLFKVEFDKEVKKQLKTDEIFKTVEIDYVLKSEDINKNLYHEVRSLGPYGNHWDKVNILAMLAVKRITFLGKNKDHAKITFLNSNGEIIEGIYLFIGDNYGLLSTSPSKLKVIFEPKLKQDGERSFLELFINDVMTV